MSILYLLDILKCQYISINTQDVSSLRVWMSYSVLHLCCPKKNKKDKQLSNKQGKLRRRAITEQQSHLNQTISELHPLATLMNSIH